MKLLITGGCGFLGSNIAGSYLADDVEVVIVDAMFRDGCQQNLEWLQSQVQSSGQLRHYKIDIAEQDPLENVFKQEGPFDYICHLAGQVAMTTSLADPRRDFRTNAVGTFNLLEAVRSHSPGSLVAYSSTNKVYGDLHHLRYGESESRYTLLDFPEGLNEDVPLDFASPYGCSKGAADQYIRDWARNYGLQTVVFRHSSIYGGRQFSTVDQGWIGWFVQKAIEQKKLMEQGQSPTPFTISGTGKQVRDVLHSSDLITLYRSAFDHRDRLSGEIFNIGGGIANSLSLLELFEMLREILQIDQSLVFERTDRRKSDQDFFVADIRKAKELLDWEPKADTERGVCMMLEWIETLCI